MQLYFHFSKNTTFDGYLSWAAVTKWHRLGGLNSEHLFLIVLEAEKSKVRVRTWLGSGNTSLSDLQIASYPCILTRPFLGACTSSSSYKGTNTIMRNPSWPHLNLTASQRPQLQTPSHHGLRLQDRNVGEHRYLVHYNGGTKMDSDSSCFPPQYRGSN